MNEGAIDLPGVIYYFGIPTINTRYMAQSNASILLHRFRGQIGKQIVVKQYGKKTVITAYPDMSRVKPSGLQKTKRKKFAEAVAYARTVLRDPLQRAEYARKLKKGQRLYNFIIREFMKNTA